MTIVLTGQRGSIRWAIDANNGPLEMLTARGRNTVVRNGLITGGRAWQGAFLPKRFTDYVDVSPFPYPPHRDGFYINKARRMGILQPSILDRYLKGWDPWSTDKPPPEILAGWKRMNPGRYRTSVTGMFTGMFADIRRWAKQLVRNLIGQMLNKFLPLVESGLLRQTAIRGARTSATATRGRQSVVISIPMPVYPRQEITKKFGHNPVVRQVLVTLPTWEVAFISRVVGNSIASQLSKKYGMSTRFGQTVMNGPPARRSQTTGQARQPIAAPARRGI